MKLTLLLALLATTAFAQDRVPTDEAQRIAHKLRETIGSPSDAPFATDVDADKPHGLKSSEVGLMVLPERLLTAATLSAATTTPTPVGQLWTKDASVAVEGRALSTSLVRTVSVGDGDKTRKVELYYLGAAKNEAGELQLLVFAQDKAQPVLRVAMKKMENSTQSDPIEIDGRKEGETGILTLHLAGAYTAEIPLKKGE